MMSNDNFNKLCANVVAIALIMMLLGSLVWMSKWAIG